MDTCKILSTPSFPLYETRDISGSPWPQRECEPKFIIFDIISVAGSPFPWARYKPDAPHDTTLQHMIFYPERKADQAHEALRNLIEIAPSRRSKIVKRAILELATAIYSVLKTSEDRIPDIPPIDIKTRLRLRCALREVRNLPHWFEEDGTQSSIYFWDDWGEGVRVKIDRGGKKEDRGGPVEKFLDLVKPAYDETAVGSEWDAVKVNFKSDWKKPYQLIWGEEAR